MLLLPLIVMSWLCTTLLVTGARADALVPLGLPNAPGNLYVLNYDIRSTCVHALHHCSVKHAEQSMQAEVVLMYLPKEACFITLSVLLVLC